MTLSHEREQLGFLRSQHRHRRLQNCVLEKRPPARSLRARRNLLDTNHGELRWANQPLSTFPRRALENMFEGGNSSDCTSSDTFQQPSSDFFNSDVSFSPVPGTPGFRQHTTTPLHRTAYTRRSAPDFNETSMSSPGKDRPLLGAARRRSRLSSQYLPNSACRGSISCIAQRSFEAFWYLKTLVGLPPPLLDFVEVAKLVHELRVADCMPTLLACCNRVVRKWSSLRVRSRFDPLE